MSTLKPYFTDTKIPHCFPLLMTTSWTPSSATLSSASGTTQALDDPQPDRPRHDHSKESHHVLAHQPGSPSLSHPDDVHDPFAASLCAWLAIPQDARRAFCCYFLNYPTPPASPRQSSRSPRRQAFPPSEHLDQTDYQGRLPRRFPYIPSRPL